MEITESRRRRPRPTARRQIRARGEANVPRLSSGFAEAAGDISVSGRTSGTKGLH
jgi:hypothetical protein